MALRELESTPSPGQGGWVGVWGWAGTGCEDSEARVRQVKKWEKQGPLGQGPKPWGL